MRQDHHLVPVEAAAADGAQEKVTLRLEGWPRSRSATLPHLSLRALEIADAISTAAWKTLRVFHTYRRPGDGSDQRLSHLKDNPKPRQDSSAATRRAPCLAS